jgi:predicted  nucleic acid-binding Zn-ribbon protein
MTAKLLALHADRTPVVNPKLRGKPRGTVSLAMVRREREAAHFRQQRAQKSSEDLEQRIRELVGTINFLKSKVAKFETLSRLPAAVLAELYLDDVQGDAEDAAEHLVTLQDQLDRLCARHVAS